MHGRHAAAAARALGPTLPRQHAQITWFSASGTAVTLVTNGPPHVAVCNWMLAVAVSCKLAAMGDQVTLRPVTGPIAFSWAIGIGLAPECRGRGYGSVAQRVLARYLFAHTQVNRIEATTEITNVAEQRALEKAGFTREGILRGATFRQGRWHDQVIYSVLRDEVKLMDVTAEDGPVSGSTA